MYQFAWIGSRSRALVICKATLKLSLSEKESVESCSSCSDSEEDRIKKRLKAVKKRRKKKSAKKKKPIEDYSDGEGQKPQRSISVFDLIPADALKSQLYIRRSKTPQPKVAPEKKNPITSQLAEVQAKLYTLKNKLWFGSGNGDTPISWGSGGLLRPDSRTTSPQKKKNAKSKVKKPSDKKASHKDSKTKTETKEKSSKYQNGLKRQTAIEWPPQGSKLGLRKSKSLPDTTAILLTIAKPKSAMVDDEDKGDKKKKKKRGKLAKKVKAISNAKTFTQM